MIKSYKIRLYPTKEQEQLMWKHIGACRYIYNYMLDKQNENYKNGGKYISHYSMNKLLTPLKNDGEHEWLYEVSNTSLQRACGDLNEAFQRFFSKINRYPKFKSKKRSRPNFPIDSYKLWFDKDGYAHIIKLKKVRFKTDRILPIGTGYKFSNARISNKNGKWILSFGVECENQVRKLNDYSMGIDLGVKDSAIVAYDNSKKLVFPNINKSRKMRLLKGKIKSLQRSISRKYEANRKGNTYIKTKNIERLEHRVRKLYERLSNIRNNYIHQSTHTLVELLPKRVVMEDLNISGMMKNRHLSKAIQEQCLYEWIRQMKHKCEWRGIEFIQVNRVYPSSKTCHKCGYIKSNLSLKDRVYICDECGYTEDRDYNAALNLMSYES